MNQMTEDNDDELDVVSAPCQEIELESSDLPSDVPMINIVLPNDPKTNNPVTASLFIRKLWKMVNEEDDAIIGWNDTGESFFIHDQVQFISKLLPSYFKHNNISSFVRQLNLYDFQKVPNLKKDIKSELQFSHALFLKDYPQLLPLIKRKKTGQATQSKTKEVVKPLENKEVDDLAQQVESIKKKSELTDVELKKLRMENSALWREMNNLQMKYAKQSKIINKLIHFLISYMQKNPGKRPRTVSTNMKSSIRSGPRIMELDYRYKNNPTEFWSEFDNQQKIAADTSAQNDYIVTEPDHCDFNLMETDVDQNTATTASTEPGQSTSGTSTRTNSSSDISTVSTLQGTNFPETVYNFIENPQVELSTIKELFKNLSSEDMVDFYKLVNENLKSQDSETTLTGESTSENVEEETFEKELVGLNQLSNFVGDSGNQLDSLVSMDVSPSRSNSDSMALENPEFSVDQYLNLDWNN